MKTNSKHIAMISLATVLGVASFSAQGELSVPKGVSADNVKAGFTKSGNSVGIDMNLNLDSIKVGRNQRIILRPMLCGENDTALFTPIVINGRNASITYRRNSKERIDGALVVNSKSRTRQVSYSSRLPYESWMNSSKVYVVEDRCGCGVTNAGDLSDFEPVATITRPDFSDVRIAYSVPEIEPVKERSESGSAYIAFPVNQTTILRDFRNNRSELNKMVSTIDITIHGYASPEGLYSTNTRLASGRAEALTSYVASLTGTSKGQFKTLSTPEDWEGLRSYIVDSKLTETNGILYIIDTENDPDARDAQIKKRFPTIYTMLLNEVYPRLRHSDYTVRYIVRPFTLDEAREYIVSHPSYLSLDEYYMVANSYAYQPEERANILYKAATMFPESETAQLDAACVSLENKDFKTAERYVSSVGESPIASNVRGIIEMQKKNYDSARKFFTSAAEGGCEEAAHNLDILNSIDTNTSQVLLKD
jgi:outer membrane protein OmpA-like peptidoglycan-associated protein